MFIMFIIADRWGERRKFIKVPLGEVNCSYSEYFSNIKNTAL